MGPTADYHDAVLRRAAAGCTRTSRRTASGTASGCSGAWATARSRACGSIPSGTPRTAPSSAINDFMRTMLTSYLEQQFADRPDLLPHVVPTYPPGAKRLLRDNGVWAGALTRDNVTLVTETIREITPTGHRHRRRRRARRRRDRLRHRLPGVELPHADAGDRARRRRPARAVGRRRPRLPRDHDPRASRTSSASTGRTPTSSSTAASSTSPSAARGTSSGCLELLLRGAPRVARGAQGRARRVQRAASTPRTG